MNHAIRIPTLYLAGGIRDSHPEDVAWREELIYRCHGLAVFLNPLAGKERNPITNKWAINGVIPTGKFIVKHDFRMVDIADVFVFNFLPLADGYPSLGTLIEFGRATTRSNCVVYSIVATNYTGHESAKMYKLHPFIEENSAVIFNNVSDCINFLTGQLRVISGERPNFQSSPPIRL